MLFNSLVFLLFAAAFFIIWPFLNRKNIPRWSFLIVASLIFYGWFNWKFIFLLAGCGLLNYYAGKLIIKIPRFKKKFLIIAIIGNIGTLAVFKYLGFITQNLNSLGLNIPMFNLALPIGISFYTFQGISYVIDIFKGTAEPAGNFLHFFAYLSIFPHLIAGPIIRPAQLLPQLAEIKKATETELWQGFKLLIYGFFKKVVIADNLGQFVNLAFQQQTVKESFAYWWIIITFFAIQIYCDFAGYTDIARGLAKLMGYEFPVNFNHPYISRSIQEFWTRWHITLSTWFRDYIFYPLLQKKVTVWNAHLSMGITMLLSGLWHGAAWTFVIWGGIHTLFFSIEQLTRWPKKLKRTALGRLLSNLIVIIIIWVAWVFFRAESFTQATAILQVMFNPTLNEAFMFRKFTILIALPLFLAVMSEVFALLKFDEKLKSWRYYKLLESIGVGLALAAVIYLRGRTQTFVYFQF